MWDPGDLNSVVLAGSAVLLLAVAAVRYSTRAGLPSLLVYLAMGLALGEAGLGLRFEDADLTQMLGTLALAVILAEGGLTTRWDVVRPVAPLAGVLATVGVFASVAITTSLVWLLLGLHTTHIVTDVLDSGVLTALMFMGPVEERRFVDVSENAVYWYFVVLTWIPIYGVIYWAPRLL